MKVTADSNVWISAFQFGGQPRRLIDMAVGKEIELAVSDEILAKVFRVFQEKFQWSARFGGSYE